MRTGSGWAGAWGGELSSSWVSPFNGNLSSDGTRNFSAALEVRREVLVRGSWSNVSKLLAEARKKARWKVEVQKKRTDNRLIG